MSPEARPAAVRFDPGSAEIPPTLGPVLTEPDSPILLLVAPDSGDVAARVAIALAEARASGGLPTVLADAAAADPRLHEVLDAPNVEGLSDVFLYGASLSHVRSIPETRRFEFVPLGGYVPDPGAVLDSPRWEALSGELEREGALMLVFVTSGTPGLAALSRRVGRAVLIGDERSAERAAGRLDAGCEVVAIVEPASPMEPGRLAAEAGELSGPGAATIFDEPRLTEPVVFRSDRTRNRRRASAVLVLLLLAAAAAGGWLAYQEYLAPMLAAPAVEEPTPAPQAAATAAPATPVETPIPVSVAVEAHQDLASALDRVRSLGRSEPDISFYLAPVSVNGVLYYRLLAGPVTDRDAGAALMQRLVEAGHKTAFDSWAIRPTGLAFHLGEYESEAEAESRVQALAAQEIPAYVVPLRYEPSGTRFRVYGGAYENQADAQVMQEMLSGAGIESRLAPRTGQPIAGDS